MSRFKDALEIFETINSGYNNDYANTIRLALMIADRVMQEPSEGMIVAAQAIDFVDYACPDTKAEFRAMIEQMMKEINNINGLPGG